MCPCIGNDRRHIRRAAGGLRLAVPAHEPHKDAAATEAVPRPLEPVNLPSFPTYSPDTALNTKTFASPNRTTNLRSKGRARTLGHRVHIADIRADFLHQRSAANRPVRSEVQLLVRTIDVSDCFGPQKRLLREPSLLKNAPNR